MCNRLAILCALLAAALGGEAVAQQPVAARALLEQAADAMGGRDRILALDNVVLTGFGQVLNQLGGASPSPDPRSPGKWQAVHAAERAFDLADLRSMSRDRRAPLFPFAADRTWALTTQTQTGAAALDHPLAALRAALDRRTQLGTVSTADDLLVIEFTIADSATLWLALDPVTHLPAWVRWIGPSATLGDVTYTAYFTGYLPFDGVQLPVGLATAIDWRDLTVAEFHVDSYRLDAELEPFPERNGAGAGNRAAEAQATVIAPGVWDVRIGGNGGAVIEFADHLTMFEAYGSEAATFARLDLANTLVPGKQVTELIVTHHHFDHTGGLRAAVARGLTVIAQRGNEAIFREMVARPAPNFPDALALDPQPLELVPVDEHLALDDGTMRVDVYRAVGHLHMANAVFAYIPAHRIFLEGDFSTFDWDWHWWGGAYLDSVERYGLDPAINIPVHGIVTSFDETIAAIEQQVARARAYCESSAAANVYPAGCPVQYSRARD